MRIALNSHFDIVGTVRNGRDAVAEVRRLDADVLVIDISMPILDGLQAVSDESRDFDDPFRPSFAEAAFAAGASAYVVIADLNTELIPAICEALEGRRYILRSMPQ